MIEHKHGNVALQFSPDIQSTGSWYRDMLPLPWSFQETVARLITLSGYSVAEAIEADQYKCSFEIDGYFVDAAGANHFFALYDYKEDDEIHIGGDNDLPTDRLIEALTALLKTVEPTPYVAPYHYESRNRSHRWPARTRKAVTR